MEDFDEDDFSDLYADVEVQASSAISAMHKLSRLPHGGDVVHEIAAEDGAGNNGVDNGGSKKFEDNCESNGGIEVTNGGRKGMEEIEQVEVQCGEGDCVDVKSFKCEEYEPKSKGLKNEESLKSKTGKIDQMVKQVKEQSKDRDDDAVDDRDLPCSSSASEEDSPRLRRNDNKKAKVVSDRRSRHTVADPPISYDLDKYGSVRISDSEEDNDHGQSGFDSDGMIKTNPSGMSNWAQLAAEPESSISGRSQHCPKFSCSSSPSAANHDREESRRHFKKYRSSYATDLRDDDNCSTKYKSRRAKPSTRDNRYRDRNSDPTGKDSRQHVRSNRAHSVKTTLDDMDAIDGFNGRGVRDMHQSTVGCEKRRPLLGYDCSKMNKPYCKGSESSLTYFNRFFPYRNMGPAYLRSHYWNMPPSFRYEAGWYASHSMDESGTSLERKRPKMDNDALEDGWHQNERRHAGRDTVRFNLEDSRKLKCSYAENRRAIQHSKEGYDIQSGTKINNDNLSLTPKCNDDFITGKYRRSRSIPYGGRDHHPDHKYDPKLPHDTREMKSPRRYNRRFHRYNVSECSWVMKNEDDRRYTKRTPSPFHAYREPCAPSRQRFQGDARPSSVSPERHLRLSWKEKDKENGEYGSRICAPSRELYLRGSPGPRSVTPDRYLRYSWQEKHRQNGQYGSRDRAPSRERFQGAARPSSVTPERHLRCLWKENHRESGRYGSSSLAFDTNEGLRFHQDEVHLDSRRNYNQSVDTFNSSGSLKKHYDHDQFNRRKHHQHSKAFYWSEEEYNSRDLDEMLHSGGSHSFERISSGMRTDDRLSHKHAFVNYDDGEVDNRKDELSRDAGCGNQFHQSPKFVKPDSHMWANNRYHESFDSHLVSFGKKRNLQSSRRAAKAEDAKYNARYKWNSDKDFKELNDSNTENVVLANGGKVDKKQPDKMFHDKLPDDQKDEFLDIEEGQIITEEVTKKSMDCVMENSETAGNGVVERLDDQKIHEIMKKMEKRRQRFRDPITLKKDPENTYKHLPDMDIETDECKIERPTRKRRWIAS